MFDFAAISLADVLQTWSSLRTVILVTAVVLLFWELAILLGVLVAHLGKGRERHEGGHGRAG